MLPESENDGWKKVKLEDKKTRRRVFPFFRVAGDPLSKPISRIAK